MSFGTRLVGLNRDVKDYMEIIKKAKGKGFTLNKKQINEVLEDMITSIKETKKYIE